MQFLFKPDLGCVIPHQRELFHHEKEILFRRAAAPPSHVCFGAGCSYFIVQRLEKFDLLFLAALNEIFAVQVPGAGINISQAVRNVDFSSSSYHSVTMRSMNSFTRAALAPGVLV